MVEVPGSVCLVLSISPFSKLFSELLVEISARLKNRLKASCACGLSWKQSQKAECALPVCRLWLEQSMGKTENKLQENKRKIEIKQKGKEESCNYLNEFLQDMRPSLL